jgi:hypothetical protein
MHPASVRTAFRLAVVAFALALLSPAAVGYAQGTPSTPAARKTQAFELCREELARRENARDVRGGTVHSNQYDDDKVTLDADMNVRKGEQAFTRRIQCVVDFDGDNRITRFEIVGGE